MSGARALAWVTVCACAAVVATETLAALGALLPPAVAQDFDELIKVASVTCEALPLELLFARSYSYESTGTDLVEFTNKTRRRYRVSSAHQLLKNKPVPLVIYVPGWWNTPTDESSTAIVEALLTKHPLVLMLDTRLSFCRGYVSSVSQVSPLSNVLYSFIKNLHTGGYHPSSIHIIGFSLGAHVAGMTGKLVQKGLNSKLGRITALDPAKPCFARTALKLHQKDAQFVHVIHSSSGVLGLEEPIGNVDVYINGLARTQPECRDRSISLECDHAQAWKLYAASVTNEKSLKGKKCATWQELVDNNCTGNQTVVGYSCSPKTRGVFLYTSKYPTQRRRQEPQLRIFNPFNILLQGKTFIS